MKSNKKSLIIFFIIVIGIVYFYLAYEKKSTTQHMPAEQKILAEKSYNTLKSASTDKKNTPLAIKQDAINPSAEKTSYKPLWQINDTDALPVFPLPEGVVIYEPVSLNMDDPYPLPGDKLAIPLPEAENAQVTVTTHHISPNGDYSWRGNLDGYGDDYPIVVTYGHRSIFATITTPQGSYALESINGSGWIYKNPATTELSKPGTEDFMEIPQHTKP